MAKRAHCKRILCTLIWIDLHFYGHLPTSSWGWWLRIVGCNWYSRYRSQSIGDTVILLAPRQYVICSSSSCPQGFLPAFLSRQHGELYFNFWQEPLFLPWRHEIEQWQICLWIAFNPLCRHISNANWSKVERTLARQTNERLSLCVAYAVTLH